MTLLMPLRNIFRCSSICYRTKVLRCIPSRVVIDHVQLSGIFSNNKLVDRHFLHTSAINKCSESSNENVRPPLPRLMNNPTYLVWPSIFKSFSNLLATAVIIKPYFDRDFSLKEFSRGAKQALYVVSNALSVGDTDSIQDMFDKDALAEIKQNMSHYSHSQLASLAVSNLEDVYFTFPYQVGIIMNDTDRGVQERFVEITVCMHILEGLSKLIENDNFKPGPATVQKYQDRVVICNYRFICEYTKGVQGQWTINLVNHFRLNQQH